MSHIRLTLPRNTLLTLLATLTHQRGDEFGWGVAGTVNRTDGKEFVLPKVSFGPLDRLIITPDRHCLPFLLRVGDKWRYPVAWAEWMESMGLLSAQPAGVAGFSPDGSAVGWVRLDGHGDWQTISEFNCPGTGMISVASRQMPK